MATQTPPLLGGHTATPWQTLRSDSWRKEVLPILAGLTAFIIYAAWAGLQGRYYYSAPYLSPLYSPLLFVDPGAAGGAPLEHAWFGRFPSWWPAFIPASPALFILPFPAVFRLTCYYFRKAYYRAFAGSPPGCAVVPMGKTFGPYRGETRLLLFQNLHRYAMYFAVALVFILAYDAVLGFFNHGRFGVGVGSFVILLDAVLIACYTFGCHSFRHLIGGRDDCMSCGKSTVKYGMWKRASWFNERHKQFAWISMIWAALSDVYVRLVSMGVIHDFNTWN